MGSIGMQIRYLLESKLDRIESELKLENLEMRNS